MSVTRTIQDVAGENPRLVARLGSVDYSVQYVRDDVEDRYSDRDLDEAYQLIMANQITGDDFRDLIGRGKYDAQTLFFDDIIVFLFPSERYEAVFASVDYASDFPVTELVERVSDTPDGAPADR